MNNIMQFNYSFFCVDKSMKLNSRNWHAQKKQKKIIFLVKENATSRAFLLNKKNVFISSAIACQFIANVNLKSFLFAVCSQQI